MDCTALHCKRKVFKFEGKPIRHPQRSTMPVLVQLLDKCIWRVSCATVACVVWGGRRHTFLPQRRTRMETDSSHAGVLLVTEEMLLLMELNRRGYPTVVMLFLMREYEAKLGGAVYYALSSHFVCGNGKC